MCGDMGDSLKQKSVFLKLTVFSGFSIWVQIAPPRPLALLPMNLHPGGPRRCEQGAGGAGVGASRAGWVGRRSISSNVPTF